MSNTRDYGKGGTRKRLDIVPSYFAGGDIKNKNDRWVTDHSATKNKDADEPDENEGAGWDERTIPGNPQEPGGDLRDIPTSPSQENDPNVTPEPGHRDTGET